MTRDDRDDYIRLLRDENARLRASIDSALRDERDAIEADRARLEEYRAQCRQDALADYIGRHDYAVAALRDFARFVAALPPEAGAADLIDKYQFYFDEEQGR